MIAQKPLTALVLVAGMLGVAIQPAVARQLHHRKSARSVPRPSVYAPAVRPPIPYAYSFYPDEIEGGVSGNLPFNNQIRKFRDPLNANGAGG